MSNFKMESTSHLGGNLPDGWYAVRLTSVKWIEKYTMGSKIGQEMVNPLYVLIFKIVEGGWRGRNVTVNLTYSARSVDYHAQMTYKLHLLADLLGAKWSNDCDEVAAYLTEKNETVIACRFTTPEPRPGERAYTKLSYFTRHKSEEERAARAETFNEDMNEGNVNEQEENSVQEEGDYDVPF